MRTTRAEPVTGTAKGAARAQAPLRIVVALLLAIAAGAAGADPASSAVADTPACKARPALPEGRPRIGLVLGGGGARGIAHLSVLRTLEELRVPIDCIAGTSMGSLVGALYASGMSVDDMEALVLGMDWERLFSDRLARPEQTYRRKRDDDLVLSQPGIGIGPKGVQVAPGLLAGERILLTFSRLVEPVAALDHFDRLPIPYRAVAADINSGEAVVIERGDLALAMRASMSIPGAFPPVAMDGRVLVDGGVAQNLPVAAARAMGADIVIAVNVGTPLSTLAADASMLKVADQLVGLLTVGNTRETIASLRERDILIEPPLGDRVATADFDKGREAIAIGLEGVAPVRERLAALGVDAAAWAQNRAVRTGRLASPPVIDFVRLDNRSDYSDQFVLERVQVPVGQPLDSARLEQQLFALYGNRTLSLATYEIVEEDGRTGVVLHVQPKVQGPNYLEIGLSMSSDYEGRFDFELRLGILRSPFNDSGGEWRAMAQLGEEMQLLGEVYQPLGEGGRWFAFGRGEYLDRKIETYDRDGDKLAQFSADSLGVVLGGGREFGNHGAILLAWRRAVGQASILVGDPDTPDVDFDIGEAYLDLSIDRLDSLYFPREGYFLRNRFVLSRESLGADDDFEQYDLDALYAHTIGPHALQAGVRYHTTLAGTLPLQSRYRLGGYSRLVGFQPNELSGQHYAVLVGGYNYRIAQLVNQPALLGFTLEYGNAWEERSDMAFDDGILNGSVYIGLDSWIGPLLFGVGGREGGERNLFLEIGRRF